MTTRYSTDTLCTVAKTAFGAAVLLAAGQCATAMAEAPGEPAAAVRPSLPIGEATRSWLDLQRGNAQAAPALPVLGAQAALAYARYLDSFKTKIPSSFDSTLGAGGNAGHANYMNAVGASPSGAN
ncbi:DUF3613 domain-containing protein [Paraburkholderia sp. NMBU_R16]|uniref:DUF3613 domain-containing protein n=1 Tax=Paraburkholderia sp. NMBU_R16 TaxID=2698676 RepID=UPI00156351D1|nr:DUF3613 domain-containing protein [Paraburkholderia sp. NMBU_R16]NRO96906.1 DUF3613 domain-containing protein [Paraburkholderia sp. NMBU_R16]